MTVIKQVLGGPLSASDFTFDVWKDYVNHFTGDHESQGLWVVRNESFNTNGENAMTLPYGQYDVRELSESTGYTISYNGCTNMQVSTSGESDEVCVITNTYTQVDAGIDCGDGFINQEGDQCVVANQQVPEYDITQEAVTVEREHHYGKRVMKRSSESEEQDEDILTTLGVEQMRDVASIADPVGQVLGMSTTVVQCGAYLNDYMSQRIINDPVEVYKLQAFLIGQGNRLSMTGKFDDATNEAVRAFQFKYQEDILTPWRKAGWTLGNNPTGYVYLTTKWKINDMMCPHLSPFPNLLGG